MEFVGCTLNICLLEYYVIMVRNLRIARNTRSLILTIYFEINVYIPLKLQEWSQNHITDAITFLVLLISLTFNIFIFCYIGQLVADQVEILKKFTSPIRIRLFLYMF